MKPEEFMTIPITLFPHQLAAVYALLGGAASVAVASDTGKSPAPIIAEVVPVVAQSADTVEASPAAVEVSDDGTLDAHGWPWSDDLHASTKGVTKDGLWRMKVGVSRPDPKPGFPMSSADAVAEKSPSASTSGSAGAAGTETAPAAEASSDEDDEFAMAVAAIGKISDAAVAALPVRKWTDADLGALCNQAAVKLGDPTPIKELIAKYVPDGEVAHSRNIFEDQREAFAADVEAKADITFAG